MRALIVEDNPKIARSMQKELVVQGLAVDVARTGREGERQATGEPYDIIILDLMLPDADGVALCRNLRRRGIGTPVLMLTALSSTSDKVTGLDAGADDYLTKPFEFEELVARVRALLRRGTASEAAVLRYDNLELDLARQRVKRGGTTIELKHKELALLEFFMRHPDRVLTRGTIGEHVWDMNFNPYSNVIDVHVSNLRRKVDKPFDRPLIHTIIGSGYRFGSSGEAEAFDRCSDEGVE